MTVPSYHSGDGVFRPPGESVDRVRDALILLVTFNRPNSLNPTINERAPEHQLAPFVYEMNRRRRAICKVAVLRREVIRRKEARKTYQKMDQCEADERHDQ